MRPTGHRWRELRKQFKHDCRRRRAVCWRCREQIDYDAPGNAPTSFEPDHYKPVKTHPQLAYDYRNLRPAHSKCNRSRGATPDDGKLWVVPTW